MRKDKINVPHGEVRRTFQGTPCFAQEKIAFDSGYREGYYDMSEKIISIIENFEDRISRMMAQRDFNILGKDFEKSLIIGEKIETLNDCIEDLRKLI